MTFTVPAGDVTTGVVWDYVRLELNDGSKAYPTAPDSGRPDAPVAPVLQPPPRAEPRVPHVRRSLTASNMGLLA